MMEDMDMDTDDKSDSGHEDGEDKDADVFDVLVYIKD